MIIQKDDWKKEKHVPLIEILGTPKSGESLQVQVSIGKEIPHPNTTEHHICWIDLYFLPDGAKFPVQVGRYEFTAHGAAVGGPNQGPVYTEPGIITSLKLSANGTFHALTFCNIHGLWESELSVRLE